MGGSTIRVPHGVHIDHSSFGIMGGDDIEAAEEGTAPEAGAPVVRIRSTNIMGGTTVQRGPRKPLALALAGPRAHRAAALLSGRQLSGAD